MESTRQTKLFIKVDGVIGARRKICTFCHETIEGPEKVVETTRKLRYGPYFPQLAYMESSRGRLDTLGRAVVCLSCFYQLLRQWSTYQNKNIPIQQRTYKYVADKGVRNYAEERANEIKREAEKRAFSSHRDQFDVSKKAFLALTNFLDAQDEIIDSCEKRISELLSDLEHCTTGEKWKIQREIQLQKKLIQAAESRIEEEEDKEEDIRKETRRLLGIYKKNNAIFRAKSEPNLHRSVDVDTDHRMENPSRSSQYKDVDKNYSNYGSNYNPIKEGESDNISGDGNADWYMVKEFIRSPKTSVTSDDDVWSRLSIL